MAGDDAALVRRAQAGDRAAFSELVLRYQRPLYAFIHRLIQNADDAADVTQEVLVRAWRYLARFEPEREFRPWLYRIAVNRVSTRRAKDGAQPLVALDDLEHEPVASDDLQAQVQQTELGIEVRRAVGQLSLQQRLAMTLVELEGQTANEAATVMGCTPATVRQHVFRGKKRLRELLAGYVLGTDGEVVRDAL